MRVATVTPLLALVLLSACDNSCQKICTRMARYAEECGFQVAEGDLADCKSEQGTPEARELRAVCRDYNARSTIQAEYSCDDVAFYWGVD
jgi:hypothetical protein